MVDLAEALKYNPFEGDFGDQGDRELSDKLVKFRKSAVCHVCAQEIALGTIGRSLTMLWQTDGVMDYRYCHECTEAMAKNWTDDGEAICARYRLRPRATIHETT
jgi:hypothetical protein